MKWLVSALVFLNLGLLIYFNLDHILPNAPLAKVAEITPEKITVLSPQQIETLPKKVVESATATRPALTAKPAIATPIVGNNVVANNACFEWGVFSPASLSGAQSAIARLDLQATVKEQTSQQAKRFWVYKPPLKTAEEAQNKAAELKALGVTDLFVVLEPRWRNAISFGVFEDEQLANKLLNELKTKGVKEVVKALRNQGKGHSSLLFSNLAANQITALKQLKSDFPEAALKEVTCN